MGVGEGRLAGGKGRKGKATDTKQEYSVSGSEYVFYETSQVGGARRREGQRHKRKVL